MVSSCCYINSRFDDRILDTNSLMLDLVPKSKTKYEKETASIG